MTSLKSAVAAAAMVSVVAIAGSVSASIPATGSIADGLSESSFVLTLTSSEEERNVKAPDGKRSTSMTEFERQSAILAPEDGDNTRLYTFGGLGAVVVVLFGLVAINRNKWGNPQS